MSFTDRYYFLALVALLLLAFADTVRRHAHAREARERAEHRSDRLALELLKRQLRPHFLLNTLTTLQEWLETEPRTAARMIDALAREFRMLDRMAQHQLVALDDELALCRAHLEVMSHRREREFGLCVRGDTDLMIPPATLHTLLENAITHSRHGEEETVFELDVQRDSERSVLTLTTPLENEGRAQDATEGTGLAYIRARLREAFGSDAEVRSASGEDRWTTRIRMPTRPRSTAHDGAQPILE